MIQVAILSEISRTMVNIVLRTGMKECLFRRFWSRM